MLIYQRIVVWLLFIYVDEDQDLFTLPCFQIVPWKLSISNHHGFGELNCKGRIKLLVIANVPTNLSKQRWKCKAQGWGRKL
jgi:hypothetical protein